VNDLEVRRTTLREVVEKLVDGSHNPPPKQEQGMPMLSARNVENGRIVFDEFRYISKPAFEQENARTRVSPGDVLLTIVGTIGRAAVVPYGVPQFSLQRSVAVLTPRPVLLSKYLCYQLQAPDVQRYFDKNARGTAQKGVYLKTLGATPILVPPVLEQEAVVAEIEKQFSRLDEAVANLQCVKANLKRYKAAVLKAAVEGRLVETEASLARREGRTYETGEQLLERVLETRRTNWAGRGKYKPPAPLASDDLPEVPDGWTWATTDHLTLLVTSGSRGWGDFYADEGVLFIRAQDIKTDKLNRTDIARVNVSVDAEGTRSSVSKGDILVTITGANVTKSALVPELGEVAFVSQHVALLKLCLPDTAEFVFSWIVSSANGRKTLEKWAYGAGKPGLNLEQVRALPIALPPLVEQSRIVAELDRQLSILYDVEAEVDSNLRRAQTLRGAILSKSF
jgi:type I restriction enzyme, S subunit